MASYYYSRAAAYIALLCVTPNKLGGGPSSLVAVRAHEGDDDHGAWTYLLDALPAPLSDMGISIVDFPDNDGGEGATAKKRIVITGGCDNADGNEFREYGWGGGFECPSLSDKVYAFDPKRNNQFQAWSGTFEELAEMPRTRNRHASVVVRDRLCVFGGRNETDHLIAEVDCYNPATNEWAASATLLPPERQTSDLAIFAPDENTVYLVGGYNQTYYAFDQVTVVNMLDIIPSYSDGPSLISGRGDIDVAVVDGDAYVSGGFTHEDSYASPHNTVEKYSMSTGMWTDVSSLNDERGDKQLVALGGKVYAIGGESKVDTAGMDQTELPELGARSEVLDSVEVLDPADDVHGGLAEWRQLGGMPGQLFRFAAAEWEGEEDEEGFIFVFGGQVGYDADCKCFRTTDKVLVFDVAHAEEAHDDVEAKSSGGSKGMIVGGPATRAISLAVAFLLWFAL